MPELTIQAFSKCFPTLGPAKAEKYLPLLSAEMKAGGITTLLRMASFLAQLGHESCDLRHFEELATGERYEGRKDLGNTQPGDGKRFKGRGPIQLTGRANYRKAGEAIGVDLEASPERAAEPEIGFKTAVWYWNSRNLNRLADLRDFDGITRAINGGFNGKVDRDLRFAWALKALAPT